MSKNKKDKKLKKKQKKLEHVQANSEKFDIIELLKINNFNTKPNTAKFLDSYVKNINVAISVGKVQVYPILHYKVSKVFIDFLDGHALFFVVDGGELNIQQYYLYDGLDEIELSKSDLETIKMFFDILIQFQFLKLSN